jgi:hypothetical protein
VGLALVDCPDPVPDGYRLQHGWTVPVLVAETHAEALRGARVEYGGPEGDGAFRIRLADTLAAAAAPPPAPESGCMSCGSAAPSSREALRAGMGLRAPAAAGGSAATSRGPALPILGQAAAGEAHP